MSQFQGGKTRVRCVDCANLLGTRCIAKDVAVAPKKRRICEVYNFKGEYVNREPAQSIYIPHMDKKVRKIFNRMLALGIVPTQGDRGVALHPYDGTPLQQQIVEMPKSTATASVLGTKMLSQTRMTDQVADPFEKIKSEVPEEHQGEREP